MKAWRWNVKGILDSRGAHYLTRLCIFLIAAALAVGMAGCGCEGYTPPPTEKLEIRTWYDLDAVRDDLDANYIRMNDLDSTTPGYEELASPTANAGKGWQPIGHGAWGWTFFGVREIGELFKGILDGQGYEIRDLYINNEDQVGLFGFVAKGGILSQGGIIKNLTLMNATVTADEAAGVWLGLHEDAVRCLDVAPAAGGVGGLVGYNRGTVSNCYATGTVTGRGSVGGLVGDSHEGTVSDSYSISSVSGNSSVGGLVGSHYDATVKKCYSAGSVAGTSSVGGLVGYNLEGTVSNSFWDIETSGQSTSAGGTGKTTAEMKNIATFSDTGWDITAIANPDIRNPSYIWNIVDGVTYPLLSWQV
jgi:hypothetical protein